MAVLEIMAAATERRQAAHDIKLMKSKEGRTSPCGGREEEGDAIGGLTKKIPDDSHSLTKLTSAVAMLTLRMEDMVHAQSDIQKQLGEMRACMEGQHQAAH